MLLLPPVVAAVVVFGVAEEGGSGLSAIKTFNCNLISRRSGRALLTKATLPNASSDPKVALRVLGLVGVSFSAVRPTHGKAIERRAY